MKRLSLALAALLALCGCASNKNAGGKKMVGMPNPFVSCKSAEDAQKAAGFPFALLDSFDDLAIQVYRAIPGQLIEAIYDSESGDEIRIRKAPGKDDPSGDWNVYSEKSSQKIGGAEVVLYANENKCGKAVWKSGGYSYSITSRDRMSLDKALKAARKVIELNK